MIKFELPGVREEDVHIKFESGILTVYGEKKQENQKWVKMEFQYGPFIRSVRLPDRVVPGKISAVLKNGILEVIIPIEGKKTSRIIPITRL